jgi:hypothetical protein
VVRDIFTYFAKNNKSLFKFEMNKMPTALKLSHRKGSVALAPEGVRAIAQGNALCPM